MSSGGHRAPKGSQEIADTRLVRRGRRHPRGPGRRRLLHRLRARPHERVTPSVLAARAAGLTHDDDILAEHIRHSVDLLMDRSRVLADQVAAGKTAVVGLSYRLADGSARLVTTRGLPTESTA
nr:putative carbonic anhydrase b-CA(1)-2 [Streptomyces sp.]